MLRARKDEGSARRTARAPCALALCAVLGSLSAGRAGAGDLASALAIERGEKPSASAPSPSSPGPRDAAKPNDYKPPRVFVPPAVVNPGASAINLLARVTDPTGVGRVTAYVRRGAAGEFKPHDMVPTEEEETWLYEVRGQPGEALEVAYFIVAFDASGNGPTVQGDPDRPFVQRLVQAPSAARPGRIRSGLAVTVLLVLAALLISLALWLFTRARRRANQAFWMRLLGPLGSLEGMDLITAIYELCGRSHRHPYRGRLRFTPGDLLRRMEAMGLEPGEVSERKKKAAARRMRSVEARVGGRRRTRTMKELAEDVFWLNLLAPVIDLPSPESDAALEKLADFPVLHPIDGVSIPDLTTLRTRLLWCRLANARDLFTQWEAATRSLGVSPIKLRPGSESSRLVEQTNARIREFKQRRAAMLWPGFSVPEVLVTLALVAMVALISTVLLQRVAQPVEAASDCIEGVLRKARSTAMATTTAYRVTLTDPSSIAVYSGSGSKCDSGTWTLEPRMSGDVPERVTLAPAGWLVCFDSRGVASASVTVAVSHPEYEPRNLQVMLGGTVRWLD